MVARTKVGGMNTTADTDGALACPLCGTEMTGRPVGTAPGNLGERAAAQHLPRRLGADTEEYL